MRHMRRGRLKECPLSADPDWKKPYTVSTEHLQSSGRDNGLKLCFNHERIRLILPEGQRLLLLHPADSNPIQSGIKLRLRAEAPTEPKCGGPLGGPPGL